MKAKVATMARRLEELELKKMHEVQAISETQAHVMPCTICQSCDHVVDECPTIPAVREMLGDQANVVGQFRPTTMHLMETPIIQAGETIQIFLETKATSMPTTSPNPSTSTNLFSGASHCEPKEVKAVITLRSGKEVDQPLPKVRQDEELMSKRTLVKESNNQEEKSGKKSASKSSIEEEPRIVIKEDMMKKHMPPPFPQALHGKKGIKNSSEILEVLRQVKEWGDATHIWKHDLGIKHIPPMQEASSPRRGEGLEEPSCLLGGDGKRSYHCSIRRTHKEQLGGPSKACFEVASC
ncbi:hypothetical protein CK203_087225 [Vitis vinifera]|uniref:Uncharacterized protein n=1 Tax=Vitis vinifera TaxID=29760 RepID=A0A438BRW7_VITVI|nr:hypothetical protein CK203_087225 [Vitis vinifera]